MNNEQHRLTRNSRIIADITPITVRPAAIRTSHSVASTSPLVDVINPQPKSATAFYARIDDAKTGSSTKRRVQSGRISRQSVTKARN